MIEAASHLERMRIGDADAAAGTVADHQRLSVVRNAGHPGPLACADHPNLTAKRKVQHRNVVGTRVGDVGSVTLRIHVDKVGLPLDANRRSDGVGLRIDHRDGAAAGIHHVHFVPVRIDRQPGRAGADRDHPVLAHVHQVEHGYGIAAAITDVGVFAIIRRVVREVPLPATPAPSVIRTSQGRQRLRIGRTRFVYTLAAGGLGDRDSTGQRPVNGRGDLRYLIHEFNKLVRVHRLCAIGERLIRLVVHLDHQAVGSHRGRRASQRQNHVALARPWLGSTMIGRWLSRCTAGTILRSRVLRVWSAKVRTPRSHRITW